MAYANAYARKRDYKARRKYAGAMTRANPITGFPRQAMRRMMGPPAAMYPRVPTNATALKSVDVSFTGSVVSSATATAVVCPVPLIGAGFYNRLGNRTRGVSLQITGRLIPSLGNASTSAAQLCRIMVIYDRQANGALPAIGTILGDTVASGTTGAPGPTSGLNVNNRDRFMVLRDRKVMLPTLGVDGATLDTNVITSTNDIGKGGLNYQEFIKLKGLETCYNTTAAGTVADISAGSFFFLIYNEDASTNAAWAFGAICRFKFLD